jgi:class 3 adenylate cyclase/ketosteroid isomerase-like protein/tetratricopeptide (TPR) repeat protein
MGVVCASCGETNRDGARFCAACGARVVARCATCDADLAERSRFCDACGAPTAATAAQRTLDEVRTQTRKVVTILFGDLVGSTALQERMDPESVRALMGRCYSVLRECVERRGGRVVKFVGDGAMALFGVPDVAEDDAARAVAAGADMVAAIAGLARDEGAALALRVGINTGEVVVDEDDPDVVGDVVNVASRLEGAAAPGTVLVSESTWRLTRQSARYAPAELVPIRGRTDPAVAHPLLAVGAVEDVAPTRFVGRAAELALLSAALDAVAADGSLRIVTVIGSPGVGKSRLGRELEARAGDRAALVRMGCVAGGGSAVASIADLLDGVQGLGVDPADGDERERIAAARRGLATGEAPLPEELFWAVRRSIEAAASADRPLVLLLEDLHWAGPLVLDLVEHLAEWVRSVPVVLVVTARPELRDLRPALTVPRRASHQVLTLEGLDHDATHDLARDLLGSGELPEALLSRLGSSTEGNPLFVRELIRMLVDDGVLRQDESGWTATVAADSVAMPPTIQALLAARIDQLSDDERTILERAAVVGTDVYRGALEALVPAEVAGRLDDLLEGLRRKELLEPSGAYWIDERVLRFHHALIRDAAYARLLLGTRARLHERTARWLEDKTGGGAEHDESIGFHLEQAHACHLALGPLDDDGRRVAAEATRRLSSAASRALDRDDLGAAAALARRAIACLDPGDPARADLLLIEAEALLGDGQVVAASPVIDELAALAPGDARLTAWATCFRWQRTAMVDPSGLDDVVSTLDAAADELAALGDLVGAAKAHRVHDAVLARLGRVAECEAALDRALSAARASSDRRQITSVLTAAPTVALWGPSPVPRAGGRCLDVIRLVRITTGARVVESTSIRSQAVLEAFRGRFDAARSMLAGARHLAEEVGSSNALMEVELSAGTVELCAGEPAAAMTHLQRAQEGLTAMGLGADAAQAAALRARAALRSGQPDAALAFVAESERLAGQDLKSSVLRRAIRAEVLAGRGELAEAIELAEAAVALAEPTDALVDHADACAALAVVRRAAGDTAGAEAAAAQARSLYERKGATALLAALDPTAATDTTTAAAGSLHAMPDIAPVGNATSRRYLESLAHIEAGRVDDMVSMMSAGIVVEDRRTGMGDRVEGREATADMLRVVTSLGIQRIDTTVLAVRGERLALVASTWQGAFELPLVALVRTDGQGRVDHLVNYGPEGLADAVAALEEGHIAGEGAAHAELLQTVSDTIDALNHRDWDRVRSGYAPDITAIDHRRGGFATGTLPGREAFVERHIAIAEIAPDYQQVCRRIVALDERVILVDAVLLATGSDRATYISQLILTVLATASGPFERFEFFDLDQLEAAQARFDELVGATRDGTHAPPGSPNAAGRAIRETFDAARAGDFERVAAWMAPDCVAEDRRPGLYSLLEGSEAVTDQLRVLRDLGVERVDTEVLATRGDQLALSRTHWIGSQFEVIALFLTVVDGHGRCIQSVCFEEAQLDEARAELDARSRPDLPSVTTNRAAENLRGMFAAVVAHDREGVRSRLTPRCTFEDRRPGLASAIDGAGPIIDQLFIIRSLGFDEVRVVPIALRGHRVALVRTQWTAGGFDVRALFVTEIDEQARSIGSVCFEDDQLDEALLELEARFRAGRPPSTATNRAVENLRGVLAAVVADDPEDVRARVAPSSTFEDRRPGLAHALDGAESVIDQLFVIRSIGVDRVDSQPVVLRGDRLVLSQLRFSGTPFEAEMLLLNEVDGDGRSIGSISWELDQLDEALIETEARFHAGEGAPVASWLSVTVPGVFLTHGDRDWEALRALYAPDVELVDHRPMTGVAVRGREAAVEYSRVMADLEPSHTRVMRRYLAVGDHVVVGELVATGAGEPGERGSHEIACLVVWSHDTQGRTASMDLYALSDEAAALARFERLVAQGPPLTMAERCVRRVDEALLAADWDALEHAFAPDAIGDDRRTTVGIGVSDRQTMFEVLRFALDSFGGLGATQTEVIGRQGERAVACRTLWQGAGSELEMLLVATVDEVGRATRLVFFDADRIDDALGELATS